MWIKKLYANFGSLDNKTLDLAPGLNIVSGKNESGKSTWSAFIRAMFFGISTREKAHAGYLPDKEKYLPWDGSAMYGKMELLRGGKEICVERTPSRNGAVLVSETALTASGEPVPTGEALLGVARGVYERSAFIGQSRISIDGDKDTEKRILSIASSGDETVSAGEVISRLEKKQKELRTPRGGGHLASLETERAALVSAIESSLKTESEISSVSESLEALEKMRLSLSRQILIAKAEESRDRRSYTDAAKRDLEKKEEEAKKVFDLPTREVYDNLVSKKNEWQALLLNVERETIRLREKEAELEDIKQKLSGYSAFGGMSPALAEKEAGRDIEKLEDFPSSNKGATVLLLLLSVVTAVFGALFSPFIFIATALFCAGDLTLLLLSRKKKSSKVLELAEKYGEADPLHIRRLLSEYLALCKALDEKEKETESARVAVMSSKANAELRSTDVLEILRPLSFSLDDADDATQKIRLDMMRREQAEEALRDAKIRLEAVLKASPDEDITALEYTEDEIPEDALDVLCEREEALSLQKKNSELSLAALRERISGFDRADAEKTVLELSAQIEKLSFLYDALALARNTLDASDRELKSRFSPEVEKRASEIFREITGGSFEVVRILDSDFDMSVATGAASAPRDKLFLSKGTYDELYLALRLALCDTILPKEEAPPMVLDDALVNFDDERAFRTLTYLKKLARNRQIILFTCHTREAEFFKDDLEVNKIAI